MASSAPPSIHHERPPFYRDVTVVKWAVQVLALMLTIGALWFLAKQAGDNLRASNVPTDYNFLSVNPGIDLSSGIDTCLLYTSPSPRDQRGSRMPSSA